MPSTEHRIGPHPIGKIGHRLFDIVLAGDQRQIRPEGLGQVAFFPIQVHANDPAALRGQKLHGEQPQKAQADDHRLFPQGEGRLPDAVQGNTP